MKRAIKVLPAAVAERVHFAMVDEVEPVRVSEGGSGREVQKKFSRPPRAAGIDQLSDGSG
jgi:hypothetical protein